MSNKPIEMSEQRVAANSSLTRRRMIETLVATGGLSVGGATAGAADTRPQNAEGPSETGTVWWTELASGNVGKAAEFYSKVIGWKTKAVALEDSSRAPTAGEATYTLLLTGDNEVAGIIATSEDSPGKTKPAWITYFQVDNVDAAIARAEAAGGKLLADPFNVGKSARMAIISDPEGTTIGLASPL